MNILTKTINKAKILDDYIGYFGWVVYYSALSRVIDVRDFVQLAAKSGLAFMAAVLRGVVSFLLGFARVTSDIAMKVYLLGRTYSHRVRSMRKRTMAALTTCGVCVLLLAMTATAIVNSHTVGVTINGKTVGYVSDESKLEELVEGVKSELSGANLGADIVIDDAAIELSDESVTAGSNFLAPTDLKETLIDSNAVKVSAYAIKVNDKSVANVATKIAADSLLGDVLSTYDTENTASTAWGDNVTVVSELTELGTLLSSTEANTLLTGGGDPEKALVKVVTEDLITTEEDVDFATKTEKTDELYVGESKVKQYGAVGTREIVTKHIKTNGVETGTEVVSKTVTVEPTDKIILEGTKAKPVAVKKSYSSSSSGSYYSSSSGKASLKGSGTLKYPLSHPVWSRGFTGGYGHNGIDWRAPKGTPVYAAASGTVISAGWAGSFGLCVKISHGNGLVTLYGHASSINVVAGQHVNVGQQIMQVGTTGRSTGYHLHFSVLVNGKYVNPLGYL